MLTRFRVELTHGKAPLPADSIRDQTLSPKIAKGHDSPQKGHFFRRTTRASEICACRWSCCKVQRIHGHVGIFTYMNG